MTDYEEIVEKAAKLIESHCMDCKYAGSYRNCHIADHVCDIDREKARQLLKEVQTDTLRLAVVRKDGELPEVHIDNVSTSIREQVKRLHSYYQGGHISEELYCNLLGSSGVISADIESRYIHAAQQDMLTAHFVQEVKEGK